MPTRQNPYYQGDPNIRRGFENLSSLFAAPSGADMSGMASAAAKRAEAERAASIWDYARGPDFNREAFDRMLVANGVSPNQSFYAVDTNAATQRYGYDTQASTSRFNNAADNRTKVVTSLYGPLNEGQVRPALPENISGMYGLPAVPEAAGRPKALNESEWKAREFERLRQSNQIPDSMIVDSIAGEKPPVKAIGPDGKPIFMSPGAAVRQGAQAYEPTPHTTNAIAVLPDKTRVTARQAPDGTWVEAQTGTRLPDNVQIFDIPKPTGNNTDIGLPAPTTANQTQANNQEAEVTRALSLLDLYEGVIRNNPGALGIVGLIRGTGQNAAASLQDLARAFGKDAPQIQAVTDSLRGELKAVAPEFFDPSIPEADFLQGTLAYALARTENPSGEVSRQAFDRALERVRGGGLLANSQSALAAITANRKVLSTQLEGIRSLRRPGNGRTDTNFQPAPIGAPGPMPEPPRPIEPPQPPQPAGPAQRWERGPDGKLIRVQ